MNSPTLTEEQQLAVRRLLAFEKDVQTLGGYAGTGKTTIIKHLKEELEKFAVCAFTGKAAHVLRRKGVEASTIHQLIYNTWETTDSHGRTKLVWELKSRDDLSEYRGIIVDEASMVGREIYEHLCCLDLPLIFVGDHGQLEPVQGKDFYLMKSPDVVLETIHRNAGEIAYFAEFVRKGNEPEDWRDNPNATGDQVQFLTYSQLETNRQRLGRYNQVICGYNRDRVYYNQVIRRHKGFADIAEHAPVRRDKIIVLRNNHLIGVFNGMQGRVKKVNRRNAKMTFEADDGQTFEVEYARDVFNRPDLDLFKIPPHLVPMDFGYVITCHKAQGDEWDWVCVLEQWSKLWNNKRWFYTAASRAREKLTWIHL